MRSLILSIIIFLIVFNSCSNVDKTTKVWNAELRELNEKEYPDNPDAENKHPLYESIKYAAIELVAQNDSVYNIKLTPEGSKDTILLREINLMEFLPTINCCVRNDSYASYIDIINQEWNRNQVKFEEDQFTVVGDNKNRIKRVDIARNCLNAYLWEVIMFAELNGELKPFYHGWFNFPKVLYAFLFEKRNHIKYELFQKPLENWVDPENKKINLKNLRVVISETIVSFENLNHLPYALKAERKRKYKNIIYPKNTTVIQDFLTDSTLFSTFSPPGIYNTKDPRKTELSKLARLDKVIYRRTNAAYFSNDTLIELELFFNIDEESKSTNFIISGIDPNDIPVLDTADVNSGWQNSMGIGNHTFYESYKNAQSHSSLNSPYFSILTNKDGNWQDSHKIGIDGPLLHWDIRDKNKLHVWILSFERHAFVGHYIVNLQN